MPSLRAPLSALLAALVVLGLGACDTYDGEDDTSLQVFVADFSFDPDDYDDGSDGRTATFDAIDATETRGSLDDALRTAGDGDLVMLYIDSELASNVQGADGERSTWAALPLVRGYNEPLFGDPDNPTDEDYVTTYFVSYEYSFDNDDLYFEVVSSLPYTSFGIDNPRDFFDLIVPYRQQGGSDSIDLRLVVVPDELFYTNGAGARIDLRDYEAVKAAYNLPD